MMKRKNTRAAAPKYDKKLKEISGNSISGKFDNEVVRTSSKKGSGKTYAKMDASVKTVGVNNGNVDNKANKSKSEPRIKECAIKFLEKFEERERLRLLGENQSQGGQNEGHEDQGQNLGQNQDQDQVQGQEQGQNTGEKRKAEDDAQNESKKLKSDANDGNEKIDDGRKVDDDQEKTPSDSGLSKAEKHGKEEDREMITLVVNEPSTPSIFSRFFPWSNPASYKYTQKIGDWELTVKKLSGHGMMSMRIFETPGGDLRIRIVGQSQNQKTSHMNGHHYIQVEILDGTTVNEISLKIPRAFYIETGAVVITQDGEFTELLATPITCTKQL